MSAGIFCEECKALGLKTKAEKYRNITLKLCTFHYWLKKARGMGFSLDDYVARSKKLRFTVSLPEGDIQALIDSYYKKASER
jgi:hypothetical protein